MWASCLSLLPDAPATRWALGLSSLGLGAWLLSPARSGRTSRPLPSGDTNYARRPGLAEAMSQGAPATGLTYLVIGSSGSVGQTLVEALLQRGETSIRCYDVAPARQVHPAVMYIQGSVNDYEALKAAHEGVDVVFATFALIRYYERLQFQYAASHAVNVVGTCNVVRACAECRVRVLIQTSSSNVCVSPQACSSNQPEKPMVLMDETSALVTPATTPNHYGWSKAQAEVAVLRAHGPSLATGCIRPCSAIFGPRDAFITQRHLAKGEVQLIVGTAAIDYVYVENIVWAHLLLERKLLQERADTRNNLDRDFAPRAGGCAFCVTNGSSPMTADDFCTRVAHFYAQSVGRPLKITRLPSRLMRLIAYGVELVQFLTRGQLRGDIALLTPAMFAIADLSYTFSDQLAREVLGYTPLYTLDEALQRTVAQWSEHRAA